MDELESVVFLPSFTSAALLGADANSHVLLCGGHTGLVRLYQVSYVVSCTSSKEKTGRGSKRRVRTGAQADDDTGVFACCALFTLAMSGPRVVVSLLATAQGVGTPRSRVDTRSLSVLAVYKYCLFIIAEELHSLRIMPYYCNDL